MKAFNTLILLSISTVFLGFAACVPTGKISDHRIIKYQKEIKQISSYMLVHKIDKLETKLLNDKEIKRKLKKLKVKEVEVLLESSYGSQEGKDTFVQFNRWGVVFFSYYENVLFVHSNVDSTLDKKLKDWTFHKVTGKIYYAKWPHAAM